MEDRKRLDPADAIFVDVIHTDGEKFTGLKGYGSLRPQGHVDFFPNGGVKQPGCIAPHTSGLLPEQTTIEEIACSHARACGLFLHSLNDTSCQLRGYACSSWGEFEGGNCSKCASGGCLTLGIDTDVTSHARGQFFLSTSHLEPYCGTYFKVKVTLSSAQGHAYGSIFLTLIDDHGHSELVDFSKSNRHYHSQDTEIHMITSASALTHITEVKVIFDPGSGLSSLGTSDHLIVDKITVSPFHGAKSSTFCDGSGYGMVRSGVDGQRSFTSGTSCP